jgi:hypothetical protein
MKETDDEEIFEALVSPIAGSTVCFFYCCDQLLQGVQKAPCLLFEWLPELRGEAIEGYAVPTIPNLLPIGVELVPG